MSQTNQSSTDKVVLGDRVPREVYEAIGRVAVAYGQFEYLLKLLTKRLSGVSFDDGMSEAERLGTFRALRDRAAEPAQIVLMDQAREAEFEQVLEKVNDAYKARCEVIHALVAQHPDGGTVAASSRALTMSFIRETADRGFEVVGQLNKLIRPEVRASGIDPKLLTALAS